MYSCLCIVFDPSIDLSIDPTIQCSQNPLIPMPNMSLLVIGNLKRMKWQFQLNSSSTKGGLPCKEYVTCIIPYLPYMYVCLFFNYIPDYRKVYIFHWGNVIATVWSNFKGSDRAIHRLQYQVPGTVSNIKGSYSALGHVTPFDVWYSPWLPALGCKKRSL